MSYTMSSDEYEREHRGCRATVNRLERERDAADVGRKETWKLAEVREKERDASNVRVVALRGALDKKEGGVHFCSLCDGVYVRQDRPLEHRAGCLLTDTTPAEQEIAAKVRAWDREFERADEPYSQGYLQLLKSTFKEELSRLDG